MTPSFTGTEQAFIQAYNSKEALRDTFDKALLNIGQGLEEFDEPTTWDECLACLEEMTESNFCVEIVQGVPGEAQMLYPLATYGWDGGSAITTKQINLTELVSVNIAGGPYADIVKRTDPSYPGVALHYAESERSLTIQLF